MFLRTDGLYRRARLHAGQLDELCFPRIPTWVGTTLVVFTDHPSRESFSWGQVLAKLAPSNPQLAIALACKALVGESFEMRDAATNLLANWAPIYAKEVMANVGSIMLDPTTGVHFFISKFPFFTTLPLGIVTAMAGGCGG